jgi:hypothetical protein
MSRTVSMQIKLGWTEADLQRRVEAVKRVLTQVLG